MTEAGDPFLRAAKARGLILPGPLADFHSGAGARSFAGQCDITRGRGALVGLLLRLGGFPSTGEGIAIRLEMRTISGLTQWRRDFGGHATVSSLRYDARRRAVVEGFGPFRVTMVPDIDDQGLTLAISRIAVLGLPLPRWIAPKSSTRESVDAAGRIRFDVSAALPVLGMLIRYRGWLVPE